MRTPMKNSPKVLGLDISTKTIGWALFDIKTQDLLELTHVSPRPKNKDTEENKMLELILKSEVFKTKLEDYKKLGIVSVIIEEPLLNSNNVYTIQTLLRFNTLICKTIYDVLGIVPEFISTYNSRKFAFPELVQENDKKKHVLFGGLPKDIDKKMIIWELVAKKEPQIQWQYTRNNTLKKENFDQTDAYACVLGYMRSKEIWELISFKIPII
jgi:RNase H-fold protein (predicted Holliday junction resolvase)